MALYLTGLLGSAVAQQADETVYLNSQNITVALGASHAEEVAAKPDYGPFINVSIEDSLANVIDAPSADAGELHNQSTHVWVTGSHLELDFDFGVEYDLVTLHFWNYHESGFDVDDVAFTFYDGNGVQVGSLEVQPEPGNSSGTDADPLFAQNYDLDFPSNVRYVNAWLTATNRQIDFNNIGFSAVLSAARAITEPEPAADEPAEEARQPGTLRVESKVAAGAASASGAIQVILDASGSMWQTLDGRYRYEVAADVLVDLVTDVLPDEVPFALRVFGNRQADVCRSDLEVALAPLDAPSVAALISGIEPQPFAGTPLAESIAMVSDDLADASGHRTVILITDGEESCDGDVEGAITELRSKGFEVVMNIIGFDFDAVDVAAARERFQSWAELGGGQYFDATNSAELADALERSVAPGFEVLDSSGAVIARGTVGDAGVQLAEGIYSVRIMTEPEQLVADVVVGKESTTTVELDPVSD